MNCFNFLLWYFRKKFTQSVFIKSEKHIFQIFYCSVVYRKYLVLWNLICALYAQYTVFDNEWYCEYFKCFKISAMMRYCVELSIKSATVFDRNFWHSIRILEDKNVGLHYQKRIKRYWMYWIYSKLNFDIRDFFCTFVNTIRCRLREEVCQLNQF